MMNEQNPLITVIKDFTERPTYQDFFDHTQSQRDSINILANADIYFNQTLAYLQFLKPNQCYAMTRWEDYKGDVVEFEVRHSYNKEAKAMHSQDVWIFNGAVNRMVQGEVWLGVPGCDNKIAYLIAQHYQIFNPCLTIQGIHKHEKSTRSYNIPENAPDKYRAPYKWVEPCFISDDGLIKYPIVIAKGRRRAIRG